VSRWPFVRSNWHRGRTVGPTKRERRKRRRLGQTSSRNFNTAIASTLALPRPIKHRCAVFSPASLMNSLYNQVRHELSPFWYPIYGNLSQQGLPARRTSSRTFPFEYASRRCSAPSGVLSRQASVIGSKKISMPPRKTLDLVVSPGSSSENMAVLTAQPYNPLERSNSSHIFRLM
jgi:hypothetical protein